MKILLFPFFFLVSLSSVYCQVDSSELNQLKKQITKSELISKYRGLIMDNILENKKTKVKDLLYDGLLKLDNDYYIALYPSEKIIISLWLEEYDFLFSEVTLTDSLALAKMDRKVAPKDDQLFRILIQTITSNKNDVIRAINNSASLSSSESEFLLLILKTYTTPNDKNYRNTINYAATDYLNKFPRSRFEIYIRNFIRYEYSQKGLHFGGEFYSGASIFNRKTPNYFKSGGTLGFGFIFSYSDFVLNARGTFVFSRLNDDIIYDGYTWESDEKAQVFLTELSIGYKFWFNKKVYFSPILGISGYSVAPYEYDKEKNPDLKNININSRLAPIFGTEFCFSIKNYYYFNYILNKLMHGFYSINIRYTYQPVKFSTEYKFANGISHNISFGLTFGFGKAERSF